MEMPTRAGAAAVLPAELVPAAVNGTAPLGASAIDLTDHGYAEREFYASGQANRYRNAVVGALAAAEVIDGGHPYTTRVLVRWPLNPESFNGTLVVEWANVSAGQDIDFGWAESHKYLLREGYAYAVVSAQAVGVTQLRTWSPGRYGNLSVEADNTDPAAGEPVDTSFLPGDPGLPVAADPLCWDIIAQVSQALKENAQPDQPLPGLTVERVIAFGESQSAARLTTYYNAIHPRHGLFDGFVYYDGAAQLRADLATPAITVNTEAGAVLFQRGVAADSADVRIWEVAGASHVSYQGVQYVDAMVLRDESMAGPSGPLSFTQAVTALGPGHAPLWSMVDTGLVVGTAIDAVNQWIRRGLPAPGSAFFDRDADGTLRRDSGGRVKGGIRLPHFQVPTADIRAVNTGPVFCQLAGHHRPYSPAELKDMYTDHEGYLVRVRAAIDDVARQGYLLPFDASQLLDEAMNWDISS